MNGFICMPHIYNFRGVTIEESGIGGPCAIRPNGDPYIRVPKKVGEILGRFCLLSDEERYPYHIGGGCTRL